MSLPEPYAIPERDTPTLTGDEPLRFRGRALDRDVLSFWRWSSSELLGNALRGRFAEYVVALGTGAHSPFREEWDVHDLETPDGITIEVKSASYLQSWEQRTHSRISFGIAPKLEWDDITGHGEAFVRAARVYVFCVLAHRDMATVDPLDLDQWEFHVLPSSVLDARVPLQKTITLSRLLGLGPTSCDFGGLANRVREAGGTGASPADRPARTPPAADAPTATSANDAVHAAGDAPERRRGSPWLDDPTVPGGARAGGEGRLSR